MTFAPAILYNGQAIPEEEVANVTVPEFRQFIRDEYESGGRLTGLFGRRLESGVRLYALRQEHGGTG